jgi:hypothetical protein
MAVLRIAAKDLRQLDIDLEIFGFELLVLLLHIFPAH